MPWISDNEYKEYNQMKVADLRERLVRRGLSRSGNKAALVSRLTENDETHPFPFMKLPAEIRNKIYKLTATTHHIGRLDRYCKQKDRSYSLIDDSDQDTIVQPGLVCCSTQTRSEGLLIFFQYHHFQFIRRYVGPQFRARFMARVLRWLDNIGALERTNIRNITIVCSILPQHMPIMDQIHAKLSNEATVTYQLSTVLRYRRDVTSMLEVLHAFRSRDPAKVPICEIKNMAISENNWDCFSGDVVSDSLRFLPGLSWFGDKPEVGVQARIEEEETGTQVAG